MDPLPISLVAHHAFCPRRAWLEAAGEQTDSYQMTAGALAHTATDDPTTSRGDRHHSIDVGHLGWALSGRVDTVETHDGELTIVEYKATPVRGKPEVTEPMRIQLALQKACLQDMGHHVAGCAVYFTTHRHRVDVVVDTGDLDNAYLEVIRTRATLDCPTAPEPLQDDPRCMRCSHAGVCLPEERALREVPRRIHVANPDSAIVHLATPGSRAAIRQGRLTVRREGQTLASLPIERVAGLVVHGNIDLSSALIRELLWRRLTVVWCSGTGRVIGWSHTANTPNGLARVRQHQACAEGRIELASEFVAAKIANQATLLRRNGDAPGAVAYLRALQTKALQAQTIPALTGYEGDAAAQYFGNFLTMVKQDQFPSFAAKWPGRSGRGAVDPINTALNYLYGVLLAEVIRAVAACGLDPHAGFLHSSGRNKPALALDLMEEFRAPLADAVVLTAINNREITESSFTTVLGSCRLRDAGRRKLLSAYERRLETEFTHPVFRYRITWRRAIEVQARMVLGYLDGSQRTYIGVRTR